MIRPRHLEIGSVTVGNDMPLTLIAGPCVMESRAHALEISQALVEMTERLGIGLIFKTSFDKANRTSVAGARGVGLGTALPIFAEIRETLGCPVVFDATHSVQQPGGRGTASGGERAFAPVLARAAVAVGVACVFFETHEDPDNAPSDGPNMIPIKNMPEILEVLVDLDRFAKARPVSIPSPA